MHSPRTTPSYCSFSIHRLLETRSSVDRAPSGCEPVMDISALEGSVHHLFTECLASTTRSTYTSGQKRYFNFCTSFGLVPLPLTERGLCLFAAFLANAELCPLVALGNYLALRPITDSPGTLSTDSSTVPAGCQKCPEGCRPESPSILGP
jgi:hypothetical protein